MGVRPGVTSKGLTRGSASWAGKFDFAVMSKICTILSLFCTLKDNQEKIDTQASTSHHFICQSSLFHIF